MSNKDKNAIIGNDGDYSFELLKDILDERNIRYTDEFKSFSEIRDYIFECDSQSKAGISHVIRLDHTKGSKHINLNVLKSDFLSTFIPFDSGNKEPTYYISDKYIGFNEYYFSFEADNHDRNYLGNYASLIAEKIANDTGSPLRIKAGYLQRSNEPFKDDLLARVMDQIYPTFIVVIFLLPYLYLLQRAVQEKSDKSRESMRMMGMLESAYWSSWFLLYTLQVLLTSIILTLGNIFTLFKG